MSVLTEAGRTISAETGTTLRTVARGVMSAMRPMLELIGMQPSEAAQAGESTEAREAAARLREAANIAEWFEATIHCSFTITADGMFGEGYLTREERIALSSAIGAALDAFRGTLADAAPTLAARPRWRTPDETPMDEAAPAVALDLHAMPLREGALDAEGIFDACLITPGWGSSGYYAASVLERDGPRVFPAGTQMFLDHPTPAEESERPERSVKDLAAVTLQDPVWQEDGWNGPGLYAPAQAIATQRATLEALAPATGLSINATGRGHIGEAEGRRGLIIDALVAAHSVDVVTRAGRGGAIRVQESARPHPQEDDMATEPTALQEASDRAALKELREQMQRLTQQHEAAQAELVRERGRRLIRETLDAAEGVPDLARTKIALRVQPVLADGRLDEAATRAAVTTAIEEEVSYLTALGGLGRVQGFGAREAAGQKTAEQLVTDLEASFAEIGLSESSAKIAAAGR